MYYANSQIDFPAYAATVFGSPPPMHHTHTHTINTDFQFFPSVCNELISRWIYCQIKVIGLRRMRSSCSPPHSHCCLHSRARAQRIYRSIVHARARHRQTIAYALWTWTHSERHQFVLLLFDDLTIGFWFATRAVRTAHATNWVIQITRYVRVHALIAPWVSARGDEEKCLISTNAMTTPTTTVSAMRFGDSLMGKWTAARVRGNMRHTCSPPSQCRIIKCGTQVMKLAAHIPNAAELRDKIVGFHFNTRGGSATKREKRVSLLQNVVTEIHDKHS